MKIVILSPRELKWSLILLAAILFTLHGTMLWRCLTAKQNSVTMETHYSKKYLLPNTYLIQSCLQDSLKGWEIKSLVQIETTESWNPDKKIQEYDLTLAPYKNLPYYYAFYYLILGLLWGLLIYHLYQFVQFAEKGSNFELANLKHLHRGGQFLSALSLVYFLNYNEMYAMVLRQVFGIEVHFGLLVYDQLILLLTLGAISMLIKMHCRSMIKGIELKNEQYLTV